MSVVTNQELTLLRTQPHSTKLWLSIYQPTTLLACQVNDGSIVKNARSITYDGVTEGSYLLVQADMTMWIGTAPGLSDKGKVRVRSITSSVITVAENSDIDWNDDDYLTIVNFYEINPVYPLIVQEDPDVLAVTFYKDYDIAYTNQNSVLGSFVCAGGHYAGWKNDQVYYSASGTFNLKGDNLTYDWWFDGADTTGSSAQTPGYISYSTPGHYTTRLIVTNASGGTDIVQRHVSIYDKPEEGTNVPILSWSLQDLSGSRDQGGYKARITLHQTVDQSIIKDGSLVVIFADDRYGTTDQSIGGNAENRQTIVFVGYILDGTIEFDYRDSIIEFEVGSPTEVMKRSEGFPVSVESKASPSKWYELLNMDCRRAIYHYLRWHSTVTKTTDIRFIGTDYAIQYFDADRESLFDAVQTLMQTALRGHVVCDRQGKMFIEVDGYTSGITLSNTFTLDKQDWMGEPEIDQRLDRSVSYIETGGIQYDGPSAGTFTALLASAPGGAPSYRGSIDRFQGLALGSQAQLNTLVGDIFAFVNSQFPSSSFSLVGNFRNFDIAPQELTSINLAPSDTKRGINFFGKQFLIQAIQWAYESRSEKLYPRIVFEEKTSGFDGDSIIIPDVPDTGGFGNLPPFTFPPFNFPPFETTPFDLYDEGVLQGQITEIDFQGSPVTAVESNQIGTVTYICVDTPSGTDSIAWSGRRTGQSFTCASGEQELTTYSTVYYANGITNSGSKFTFTVAGVYFIGINGNFSIDSGALCANKGTLYNGTVNIKHYDSADTLLATYAFESSDMYCFTGAGGDVAIDKGFFQGSATIPVSAGDYFKITFSCSCPATPTGLATIGSTLSAYRVT